MIKKFLFLLPLLSVLFFSCKKQETPDAKFTFTATLQSSNHVNLSWAAVKLAEFKNITVYRSSTPIPDPTFQTPIDGNLIVDIITDKTITSFNDSNFSVGSSGAVYYKLVLNLNNRFIVSELEQVSFNAFSLILPSTVSQFGNSFATATLSQRNSLYVINYSQGTISLIDYVQKKIMVTTNFSASNIGGVVYATIDNGSPELFFIVNNTEIVCYDGVTLNPKYSVFASNSIMDFKVKNGFLYVLNYGGNLATYNLSSQSLVNQIQINNSGNSNNLGLFTGNFTNQLYVKYSTQMNTYQPSTNTYIYSYKNVLLSYNLANGIPSTYTNLNIAALNIDTLNSNNINSGSYCHLSSDGKYLACNQSGDVYSFVDNSTHNIRSSNNFNPYASFSDDGKFVMGRINIGGGNSNFPNSTLMDVYALPGFNLVTSLKTLNTGQFTLSNDFMTNDTLISYNIAQNFTSGQTISTLTVLFKKID
ncbi:MAG TPA: hypothetical protein VK835_13430 [Bacteroidia bacterium]|jgi:hypothetical protein|nr:hypothetical protein [Bacteroidia bacterium]